MNEGRREIIQIVIVVVAIVFLVKLFSIQVLNDSYKNLASVNAIRKEIQYPVRGLIRDRNGKLIVFNNPEYDLLIILKEVKHFDSTRFCEVFQIDTLELRSYFKALRSEIKAKKASPLQPTPF